MDPDAYLARIGAVRPAAPSAEALRGFQVAHVLHVPFEILDIGLGRPISLQLPAPYARRVVGGGRGRVGVGWGALAREPLRLVEGLEQVDSLGRAYRLDRDGDDWTLFERQTSEAPWAPQHRFTLVSRGLADFVAMCHWQETEAPYFTSHRLCTLGTPEGRVTLHDDRLIVHAGRERNERAVDERGGPELLRELVGVVLDTEARLEC